MFNGIEVTLQGNLTSEPQLRYLQDGTAVTNLNIAVNRRWSGSNGQRQEEVTWVRADLWGKQATSAAEYLSKGQRVTVRGRLKPDPLTGNPRVYQRQDGTTGASFEVRVYQIDFGRKPNGNGHHNGTAEATEDEIAEIPF